MRWYDVFAPAYDLLVERVYRPYRIHLAEVLPARAGGVVLDVASGTGQNFAPLLQRLGEAATVIGVDVSTGMLAQARRRVRRHAWSQVTLIYRLGEPAQGSVGVVFGSGATVLCANFGGTVKADSGTNPPNPGGHGQFVAVNAAAPGACPLPPDTCRP